MQQQRQTDTIESVLSSDRDNLLPIESAEWAEISTQTCICGDQQRPFACILLSAPYFFFFLLRRRYVKGVAIFRSIVCIFLGKLIRRCLIHPEPAPSSTRAAPFIRHHSQRRNGAKTWHTSALECGSLAITNGRQTTCISRANSP